MESILLCAKLTGKGLSTVQRVKREFEKEISQYIPVSQATLSKNVKNYSQNQWFWLFLFIFAR